MFNGLLVATLLFSQSSALTISALRFSRATASSREGKVKDAEDSYTHQGSADAAHAYTDMMVVHPYAAPYSSPLPLLIALGVMVPLCAYATLFLCFQISARKPEKQALPEKEPEVDPMAAPWQERAPREWEPPTVRTPRSAKLSPSVSSLFPQTNTSFQVYNQQSQTLPKSVRIQSAGTASIVSDNAVIRSVSPSVLSGGIASGVIKSTDAASSYNIGPTAFGSVNVVPNIATSATSSFVSSPPQSARPRARSASPLYVSRSPGSPDKAQVFSMSTPRVPLGHQTFSMSTPRVPLGAQTFSMATPRVPGTIGISPATAQASPLSSLPETRITRSVSPVLQH